jgi:hypothetical protein
VQIVVPIKKAHVAVRIDLARADHVNWLALRRARGESISDIASSLGVSQPIVESALDTVKAPPPVTEPNRATRRAKDRERRKYERARRKFDKFVTPGGEHTLTEGGLKKRIFHLVRPHVRSDGTVVKMHFRGEPEFTWASYQVKITVLGRDHFTSAQVNLGFVDETWTEELKGCLSEPEIGRMLRNRMDRGQKLNWDDGDDD